MRGRVLGTAAISALLLTGYCAQALADEKVETVVVTAERRTTNVQTTPIAVTVLTAEDLKNKSINTVDQLQFATPSLTINNFGQGNDFNIRGIGKGESNIQTPSGVVTYRDGVPVLGGFLQDEPWYDIASVEVLRGPQGTFAGTNATGGAVFITEQNPALGDSSGYVQGQVGNYADVGLQGAVDVPVSDDVALRFAAYGERRDSFWTITKGPAFSGDPGSLKEGATRVSLLWQPLQNLEVLFKTDLMYIDTGGYPADFTCIVCAEDIFHVHNNTHNMGLEEQLRSVLDIRYTFGGGIQLRSLTGYQYARAAEQIDLTPGLSPVPLPITDTFRDLGKIRLVSTELDLISPDSGPFRWVIGGFFQHEDDDLPQNGGFDIGLPAGAVDVTLAYHTPKQHEAVFGQATYDFNEQWELQVGARFNASTFDLRDNQETLVNFGAGEVPVAIFDVPCTPPVVFPFVCPFARSGHEADSKLTEKVALNFKPDDTNFLYAFFATGHKDGGQNTTSDEPPNILPEDVRNVEIGWKSGFWGEHIRTQLDAYWNDYKNFQVTLFDPTTQTSPIVNAPAAKIWGFEGQMQGSWDAFSFDLNADYLHSRFGGFFAEAVGAPVGTCNPHTGGTAATCQNLTGNQNVYAPDWTVNGGVQYAFVLGNGDTLTPRIDYAYVGTQYPSVFQNPLAAGFVPKLGVRNILNAQLSYAIDNSWLFTLYGTNLTNLHYVAAENVSLRYAGAPLQFGLRVDKSF